MPSEAKPDGYHITVPAFNDQEGPAASTTESNFTPARPPVPHLVNPLRNISFVDAIAQLELVHSFLVQRAGAEIATSTIPAAHWGIGAKRLEVKLDTADRPPLVGKQTERFGEIVNMAATIERMIPLLRWFSTHNDYSHLQIVQCHPSTSDEDGGNDLVLGEPEGSVVVRCEVCDVASRNAGSNGKERSDLEKLGCAAGVPSDGVRRFIYTAREFAEALRSNRRKWNKYTYRYDLIELGDAADTCLLALTQPDQPAGD